MTFLRKSWYGHVCMKKLAEEVLGVLLLVRYYMYTVGVAVGSEMLETTHAKSSIS